MTWSHKINGLNKSDLLLIAARPGMGKTSLALNIALDVAKKSAKTVAFFSLEMSREQLAMRLLSNESFVDNQKLLTGRLTEEEWTKIGIASSALSQTDIRVDDNPSISVAEMNAKCPPPGQPGPGAHRLSAADDLWRATARPPTTPTASRWSATSPGP